MTTHKLFLFFHSQWIGCIYAKIACANNSLRNSISQHLCLCHVGIFIKYSLQVTYHTVIKNWFVIIIIALFVIHQVYHCCTFRLVEYWDDCFSHHLGIFFIAGLPISTYSRWSDGNICHHIQCVWRHIQVVQIFYWLSIQYFHESKNKFGVVSPLLWNTTYDSILCKFFLNSLFYDFPDWGKFLSIKCGRREKTG